MQGRRGRRTLDAGASQTSKKIKINKKQVVMMLIMLVICVFTVSQTAYLFKYTMGQQIESKHLRVYNWVKALVNNEQINQ